MSTGTNKERLEQNNAKIDSLINLVKSKGAIPSKLPQLIDRSITELTAEDFGDITVIGNYAFYNCKNLEKVTLPDTITNISENAFDGCETLTSISIPNTVTRIGGFAFQSCKNLELSELPTNLQTLATNAFYYCTKITINKVPDGVKSIGSFKGCTSITSFTIHKNVTTISSGCFQDCTGLTSVTYEGQAPNIGSRVYQNCTSITLYDFSNCTSVPSLSSVSSLGHATGCAIRIPGNLYDTWTTATNWSALTDVVWEIAPNVGGLL